MDLISDTIELDEKTALYSCRAELTFAVDIGEKSHVNEGAFQNVGN